MSYAAPAVSSVDALDCAPPCRPFPRVHQMMPGRLFQPVNDPDHVFALLSHDAMGVMDGARIWCVVIAAHDASHHQAGMLVALPRDAQVEPLRVAQPMRLAVVR